MNLEVLSYHQEAYQFEVVQALYVAYQCRGLACREERIDVALLQLIAQCLEGIDRERSSGNLQAGMGTELLAQVVYHTAIRIVEQRKFHRFIVF